MRWPEGFIAVDWGTTNRRAYLIDAEGRCAQEFEDSRGVLSVPVGGFPDAVAEIRDRLGDQQLLLAGMIGSNRGWIEAPYIACPAGLDDLAGKVLLRHGAIQIFGTVMTGELFNLLKEHSILADLLQTPVDVNDAFKRGVRRAMDGEMLPADLFGVRAAVLLGQANKDDASSYVSGLLIGTDVRIGLTWPASARIGVIGRPELTRLYAAAISETNREAVEIDGELCFLAGIHHIAERIA